MLAVVLWDILVIRSADFTILAWFLFRLISYLKWKLTVSCFVWRQGSISISMRLQQTTFCLVCTHLASGEKEGDEIRRNSDVSEILKKTRFSQSGNPLTPDNILDHE